MIYLKFCGFIATKIHVQRNLYIGTAFAKRLRTLKTQNTLAMQIHVHSVNSAAFPPKVLFYCQNTLCMVVLLRLHGLSGLYAISIQTGRYIIDDHLFRGIY